MQGLAYWEDCVIQQGKITGCREHIRKAKREIDAYLPQHLCRLLTRQAYSSRQDTREPRRLLHRCWGLESLCTGCMGSNRN